MLLLHPFRSQSLQPDGMNYEQDALRPEKPPVPADSSVPTTDPAPPEHTPEGQRGGRPGSGAKGNSGLGERLAYSIQESADLLGVNYYSVYRLVQRRQLKVCRALRGKLLIPRSELLRLLKGD